MFKESKISVALTGKSAASSSGVQLLACALESLLREKSFLESLRLMNKNFPGILCKW